MANLYDILAGAQHGEAMAEFGRAFGLGAHPGMRPGRLPVKKTL